ncbi:beta-N-acetylhexosaminidase [Flavobacteriaceae bacterium F89]|uniref:beta-N-acetylhexosaminidase n=1 Tax=Cerina litoralis TaxID=2874477 RepID=A0AAE3EVM3_9FLAO|nr:family 20 glycosylhydrolase [Cerina litoralis]MCG2461148.1 beta-N-acetylhexosaminidase [Cerina litoralis]
MRKSCRIFFGICLLPFFIVIGCADRQKVDSIAKTYPIIPSPTKIVYGQKEIVFHGFSVDRGDFKTEASKLMDFLKSETLEEDTKGLKFKFRKGIVDGENNTEAYQLDIDSTVTLIAQTAKGAFYGVQTLKQLFRKRMDQGVLPKVRLFDRPAFKIRGFMHDTGRNFQSVAQLKEQIDVLALYKYNVFHWHLTDNPGWRLESEIYPELQSEKSFSRGVGRYYTQKDFKDVLAYCKARHITVIPEFDIPGHTDAFRKAFGFKDMRDPKVLPILLQLFEELCGLADAGEMPYIHIGTDEVRESEESVPDSDIRSIMDLLHAKKREVIVWKAGIDIPSDSTSINQLWAQYPPKKSHRFIDSRSNYINHLDPFSGMSRLYFQQPCRQSEGDSIALGGILCAWPDNNVANQRDILRQNPIYPSIVFYSEAIWNGRKKDHKEYWANLPSPDTPEFKAFKNFEDKVLVHRNLFFRGKEFPYVRQTDIEWQLIGPFDHKGETDASFPVEDKIMEEYMFDGHEYRWTGPHVGGTIHLHHFFDFPSVTDQTSGTFYAYTEIFSPDDRIQEFWIGFQGWSRAGGRRGGPTPKLGQWHTTDPKIWVNGSGIPPPHWKQPNLGAKTDEIPFVDEDYFYREPTNVKLKMGWNKVLLKIPQGGSSWKWMFTCVPLNKTQEGVRESTGLRFRTKLPSNSETQ